jgi:hypothetical protein
MTDERMNWDEAELPDWFKKMNLGPSETWPSWVTNMTRAQAKEWLDWLKNRDPEDRAQSDKEWADWMSLCAKGDADRAWDIQSVETFHSCCLDDYDFDKITHRGEIRDEYQWSRVWCISSKRLEWRWLPLEPDLVPEYEWVGAAAVN